jgi:hypothetical protein
VSSPLRVAAALLLLVPGLSACAVGGVEGGDRDVAHASPRPDLARRAEVAARNERAGAKERGRPAARDGSGGEGRRTAPSPRVPDDPGAGSRPAAAPESWEVLVTAGDPAGDAGRSPAYADVRAVRFATRGDDAALQVVTAATVPARLAAGEVVGLGIDLFRGSGLESDHQVFLDGGADGWRAYLQTPRGFVRFPGSFALRGTTLDVTLPWSALGGRDAFSASAFLDWSDGRGASGSDTVDRVEVRP